MNSKTLGTLALIGAPTMLIGTLAEAKFPQLFDSWFTGLWGLVYICAFMCSILAIGQSGILGSSGFAKTLPVILLGTLAIANVANLVWLVAAKSKPSFFMVIDLCWPLSHVLLLVLGITAVVAKRLQGWQRFVPLAAGLWLPVALTTMAVAGRTGAVLFFGGVFNAAVMMLLAMVVRRLRDKSATTSHRPALQPMLS